MNVTYFTGAGASANALPVWKAQASAMLMGEQLLNKDRKISSKDISESDPNKNPFELGSRERLLWDMAWFGYRAEEFGSIDTFAKKLFLNTSYPLLQRLKLAVSINFSLMEFTDDLYSSYSGKIDPRYIKLFAQILSATANGEVYINPEYSFITWNYDLQLERAFRKFSLSDNETIERLCKLQLGLGPDNGNRVEKAQVIHLNGFHGAYQTGSGQKFYVDRAWSKTKSFEAFLHEMSFLTKSAFQENVDFNGAIRYAWERESSEALLSQAKSILQHTNVLVIIGYSFPAFNRQVDRFLFKDLPNLRKVIIQDENVSESMLREEFNLNPKLKFEKHSTDQFWAN